MARVALDENGLTVHGRRLGRPKVDHSALACTGCGAPRDAGRSRCRACCTSARSATRRRNPEASRTYLREWGARNPDKVKANTARRYAKNPERAKASARQWARNNPAKRSKIMVFQNAKRRSRLKANGGNGFTRADWDELLKRCAGLCAYCRMAPSESVDHFIPVSKGGAHNINNVVPACKHCNSWKRERDPVEWIRNRFGASRLAYVRSVMFT